MLRLVIQSSLTICDPIDLYISCLNKYSDISSLKYIHKLSSTLTTFWLTQFCFFFFSHCQIPEKAIAILCFLFFKTCSLLSSYQLLPLLNLLHNCSSQVYQWPGYHFFFLLLNHHFMAFYIVANTFLLELFPPGSLSLLSQSLPNLNFHKIAIFLQISLRLLLQSFVLTLKYLPRQPNLLLSIFWLFLPSFNAILWKREWTGFSSSASPS